MASIRFLAAAALTIAFWWTTTTATTLPAWQAAALPAAFCGWLAAAGSTGFERWLAIRVLLLVGISAAAGESFSAYAHVHRQLEQSGDTARKESMRRALEALTVQGRPAEQKQDPNFEPDPGSIETPAAGSTSLPARAKLQLAWMHYNREIMRGWWRLVLSVAISLFVAIEAARMTIGRFRREEFQSIPAEK